MAGAPMPAAKEGDRMRRFFVVVVASVALLGHCGFVARKAFGYDWSTGAICFYDGSAKPQCGATLVADKTSLARVPVSTAWAGQTVRRLGFKSPGDGGAADYRWSTSACTINSGAGDGALVRWSPSGGQFAKLGST